MAQLITKPSDANYENRIANKKHKLKIPAYCWDVPKIINVSYKRQACEYINLYLNVASSDEMEKISDGNEYCRILMYQEQPNFLQHSHPYIYVYSRPIADSMPQHRKELDKCPNDSVAAEINLATFSYFVWIKKTGWKTKQLTLDDITLIDVRDNEDDESDTDFKPYLEARYYVQYGQNMRYLGREGNPLSDELANAYFDTMRDIENETAKKHLGTLIGKFVSMARFHPTIKIPENSDDIDVEFKCDGCDLIVCIFMKCKT
ncbi:MAG: hypothetical protein H0U27_14430 [Nitrosopumilus sp.]|nr:hypothetical protein [Nitrosopumilus sp.]